MQILAYILITVIFEGKVLDNQILKAFFLQVETDICISLKSQKSFGTAIGSP